MVWEWIYIQRPFVKSLIDCWAFKSSTAWKYAGVTQRKQHSHALVGTKVSDISRRRGKQTGRRRALPALDGCSVSKWSVCVYVSERGRHTGRITGAWMHFAEKRKIIRWSPNDAGLLNVTGERGEASACSSLYREVVDTTHHLAFLRDSCQFVDAAMAAVDHYPSSSQPDEQTVDLEPFGGGNSSHDIISAVMDGQHACSSVS